MFFGDGLDIVEKDYKYICHSCDFNTCNKTLFNRHLLTAKHKNVLNSDAVGDAKNTLPFSCDICNRGFNTRNGKWSHMRKCSNTNNITGENKLTVHTKITPQMEAIDMVNVILKENTDFKKMMFEEFRQMMLEQNKTILELASKQQTNSTQINNNTQINKQKFNLNFFLNETCKDAMNITDFVNSLQIQFSDLEKVGELGYAEGISRIFMKGLKALDVCKRPIHCTDLKREIVHIKNNNQWEKEISLLQKAIKIITNNNINKITDWKNAHPGCTDGENKLNDKYCKILYESMGPIDEEQEQKDFSKIIRNIAKCTVIDKAIGDE